jgi:hypothetical protein
MSANERRGGKRAVIPFRFGERGKREITVFELGHAPGAFDEHHAEQAALPGRNGRASPRIS